MSPPNRRRSKSGAAAEGKRVAVVVVGDEVLAGEVEEHNALFISREVTRLGSKVARVLVLPDEEEAIAAEVRRLASTFDAVLVTGGIGVTHDDVTRQGVARAFGLPLAFHPEALGVLRARHGRRLGPWRRKLAELPAGSRVLLNPKGTAPGFAVGNVYVFPGVPHMLREMFPGVAAEFSGLPRLSRLIFTDLPESAFAGPLSRIAAASAKVSIGSYPLPPGSGHKVRLVLKSADEAALRAVADRVERMLARLERRAEGGKAPASGGSGTRRRPRRGGQDS